MGRFLLLTLAFLLPSVALAQHCGTPVSYGGHHVVSSPVIYEKKVAVKEVVTPVTVAIPLPVFVPTFSYQYVPPPCPQTPGTYVPGYGTTAVGVPPQYSPQPAAGAAPAHTPAATPTPPATPAPQAAPLSKDDHIRQLAKALLLEMQKQDGQGAGQDDGPPVAPDLGGPAAPAPAPAPAPQPQTPAPAPAPQMNGFQLMSMHCASCHTGNRSKGGVVIFTDAGQVNPLLPKAKIFDSLREGRMPPPGKPRPSAAEIQAMMQAVQ